MLPIEIAVPTRYPAVVSYALIGLNCVVFLFQISLGPRELELFLYQFALIPARYSRGARWHDDPGAARLPAVPHQHVPARRLAASDPEHVDTLAVRPERSRTAWGLGATWLST